MLVRALGAPVATILIIAVSLLIRFGIGLHPYSGKCYCPLADSIFSFNGWCIDSDSVDHTYRCRAATQIR
jgi:hypothetical protein